MTTETPLQRALSLLAWGVKHTECSTEVPHECVIALLEHIEELENAAEGRVASEAEIARIATPESLEALIKRADFSVGLPFQLYPHELDWLGHLLIEAGRNLAWPEDASAEEGRAGAETSAMLTRDEEAALRKRIAYQIRTSNEEGSTWIDGEIWTKTLALIDYLRDNGNEKVEP